MLNETKTIDKNIPVPLYYQLKELILEAINENKYTAGDVIPTEKEISSYYRSAERRSGRPLASWCRREFFIG